MAGNLLEPLPRSSAPKPARIGVSSRSLERPSVPPCSRGYDLVVKSDREGRTGDAPRTMKRQRVSSSSLVSLGYDRGKQRLGIEFHSGSVYWYLNVPEDVYRELMQSPSLGEYVNRYIKTRFRVVHVV
jgi:hypothetical protein